MRTIFPSLRLNVDLLVFILLLFAFIAYGQEEQKRVAILRTVDDGEPSVEITDLFFLTGRLREIAGNVLQNNYGIMTEQSIIDKLGGREIAVKVCKETEGCLAQLGRRINADYIGQARLGRFGGNLTIVVELYNSGSGLQAAPAITGQAEDISGLLDVLNKKAPEMFGKMPGIVYEPKKPVKTSFWVALGLDILGVAVVSVGVVKNSEMNEALDKYNKRGQTLEYYKDARKDAESSRNSRNMLYVIGGVALASGMGVHIWF
ncbi:MAG: hypothetical protein LBC75_06115 [Fibromonadaceae bacterium]|jgi:hypothetical protein|nr:hypothetical protein [Fibromonadaceae bacterium]